ncbi:hybrid sensor histidine kinase/response regulator transcription factor [Filimonas effusa]|uniref:histidine kinase n=1 Tax=Filimonas effusa TaxID=2508721 RepID=A0A4Q1D5U2_9BACT|nr:two-component regulator propeller domain-containing protein [Filimonas effusa]RXK83900.1 response regulator [Filimonas effusa]
MRPFVFLLLVFCYCKTIAQHPGFQHLSVADGLSQNSVLSITQDAKGFMWYGTRSGLNKYDSRKITIYKNRPGDSLSLSSDYILSLLSDRQQNLWVGTRKGLNRYDALTDRFNRIALNVTNGKSLKNNDIHITSLLEDSKGRLWVGTSQCLLLLRSKGQASSETQPSFFSFEGYQQFPSRGVMCLYEDRSGAIWVGTYDGAVKITGSNDNFHTLVLGQQEGTTNGLRDNQITSITQDKQGWMWMGTLTGGLHRCDSTGRDFSYYTHSDVQPGSLVNNHVRKLIFDNDEQLWIGTQEGISVMDTRSGLFRSYVNDAWDPQSLSQNSVHSFYKDNAGTIWVGTFFGGVNYATSYHTSFQVFNNRSRVGRLSNNVVSSIIEDNDRQLWIGTEGGGLNCIDAITRKVTYYQHKPSDAGSVGSNLIKTIYKDKQGLLWIGTHGGGLNLFESNSRRFTRYLYKENDPETQGAEITALLEDSRGLFWIGTDASGLKLYRKNGKELNTYTGALQVIKGIGNRSVLSFLEVSGGEVWIGTSNGLFRTDGNLAELRLHLLENKSSSYPYHVNSLTRDRQGNIWVGTYYNGINVYDNTGKKIASYTQEDGLPDNNILGILEDEATHSFWISTANGLARFSPANKRFTVYTEADGIAGNVFNNNAYYKNGNGMFFFGGFNGLSAFYPGQIKENTLMPPIVITDLKLFNKPVVAGDGSKVLSQVVGHSQAIKLKYDQNVFSIDFAILNYIKPEKNRYAWRLEGFDQDWNYGTVPTASYTNIPPGDYHFLVKGANNDGTWSKVTRLQVSVLPPFWKTWWAYSFYILLVVTLAFFITRFFFLRALLQRNQELTQLKLNFFTNISHEIRTHLSLIIGPAERMLLNNHNDENKQQLRTIKNNSESLLQLVNELMDFRKAETGHLSLHVSGWNLVAFLSSISESFHELSVTRNIRLDFISATQDAEVWFDKEQLKKVFYNLLSNAFKFTADGGYISIVIEEKKATVDIKVTDNGKGISKENIDKLFDNYFQEDDAGKQNTGYGIGLALSKSIVEMHKGQLHVSSEPVSSTEHYTCFTVSLLKGSAHFKPEQIVRQTAGAPEPEPAFDAGGAMASPISEAGTGLTPAATILLVEDNPSIRSFIREALQNRYHILESSNGVEGLEVATAHIPDLIISDVMMPEMDGFSFCSKVKTDARTNHIPVILLTAKTAVAHQVSGLETGADIYLTKPFSIQVLELQIRNLLASRERLWQRFQQELQLLPARASDMKDSMALVQVEQPALHPLDAAFIADIKQMVEEHMEDPDFGIALLAKKAAMSQPVLFKKIKAITGMTANDFVKSLRLKRATELLRENRYTVYEVSYMVGYENSKYFSREFKKQFGKTPTEWMGDGR